jgi:mono/diheme cytochrome c family protein
MKVAFFGIAGVFLIQACLQIDSPMQPSLIAEPPKKLNALAPSFQNVKSEILNHCGPCHLGNQSQGGFSAVTYNDVLNAVVPGDPEMSLLTFVLGPNGNMPPKAEKISEENLQLVKDWIALGALDD